MHPKVYEAAKSGDADHLNTVISGNGEDLFHQTTPKKNNILHVAAQYKQVNVIKYLLQFPSGPSLLWESNCKGDTPLHVAAKVGSPDAVEVFVDLANSLSWVAEEGQDNACRGLLRMPNMCGYTTLHHAVGGGHGSVVKLLIEEDPELCNITNASDESPLYLAAHRRLSDIIKLISDGSPSSSSHKGPKGLTALHAAVHFSLPNWWEILEKRPEDIREGDDMAWTPLHYAACFGNVKAVRRLLQYDTLVAYNLDKEGESALHVAASRGHVHVIDELVKSCSDACDIINNKGQTALHATVIAGQIKVVKHILRMPNLKDLINEEDTDGNTALHLAMLRRRYRIVFILARDKRVDRFATNRDHLTALDILFAREEVSFGPSLIYAVSKESHGFPVIQDWVLKYVKKRSDKQFFEDQSAESMTTGRDTDKQENSNSSIRKIVDSQLLVAAFIATVTFAAAFTMPGGYHSDGPNQGMATLAGRAAFKAFVISNTIAFGSSIQALFLRYNTSSSNRQMMMISTWAVGNSIHRAILGMVLAFASGTYVVLTRTIGLGIVPYVVIGFLVADYTIGGLQEPQVFFGALRFYPSALLRG